MSKKIKSILEELTTPVTSEQDKTYLIESRANNAISSAVRILEQFDAMYGTEQAEIMTRKFLNAIRNRNPDKFSRYLRNNNDSEE